MSGDPALGPATALPLLQCEGRPIHRSELGSQARVYTRLDESPTEGGADPSAGETCRQTQSLNLELSAGRSIHTTWQASCISWRFTRRAMKARAAGTLTKVQERLPSWRTFRCEYS